MTNPILQNRAQSGFPVSIATGLALQTIMEPTQSVFDEARIVPDRPEPTLYTDYMINVSTLTRNIITSMPFIELQKCSTKDVLDTLIEEMDYLGTLFKMQEHRLHFYIHSYSFVHAHYDKKLRTASTAQQVHSFKLLDTCMTHVKRNAMALSFSKDIHLERASSALVMTHVPWDLLSHGRFKRLDLLESHTGVIKTRKDWNTKYFKLPEKDMSFLPFMEYLLTTFGDGVMFKPAPIKDREKLYNDLLKKKVHPLMSETSLMFSKT